MRFAAFLLFLVLLAGGAITWSLLSFNHFSEIERSFEGRCTPVAGIAGPEDIQVDARRGRVFISSLNRREEEGRGGIHVFKLSDPLNEAGWRDVTNGQPAGFRPLGIDYFEDGEVRRLFVVNEAAGSVEVFDVAEDGGLIHLETFAERRLTSPNNVVALGPRAFYVTNDVKPGRNTALGDLHFLTRQSSGEVFFVDGDFWRLAAEDLHFANGIEISADGSQLFVAETSARRVRIYDRDAATGVLTEAGAISLPSAPDNLTVDEQGDLWVAALPKPLATPRHKRNPDVPAPSEVIRIDADGHAQTVYRDDGSELSASTAAARLGDLLVIGALYDEKFLICNLPAGAF